MNENGLRHGENYWKLIEPIWDKVSIYDSPEKFLEQFDRISEPQQNLFAIHWCRGEVDNGGLHQFFWNPTGILAPEAIIGFHSLGFHETADVVEKAILFFNKPYPRDCEKRRETLSAIEGKTREEFDPFYKLDDQFYASLNEINFPPFSYYFERVADEYANKFLE